MLPHSKEVQVQTIIWCHFPNLVTSVKKTHKSNTCWQFMEKKTLIALVEMYIRTAITGKSITKWKQRYKMKLNLHIEGHQTLAFILQHSHVTGKQP